MTRAKLPIMLSVALLGAVMQLIGRARVSTATSTMQDLYRIVTVLGVATMSFASAVALFVVLHRRWPGALATGVALAISLCVALTLLFCGMYWPWMLGM